MKPISIPIDDEKILLVEETSTGCDGWDGFKLSIIPADDNGGYPKDNMQFRIDKHNLMPLIEVFAKLDKLLVLK